MTGVSSPPRAAWGDAAKGLLIVLVVFWHVVLKTYLQVDWRIGIPIPGVWGLAGDLIWPFLMPLFLLVSGYFAAGALTRPWAAVGRPRVVRYLYLYLVWTLIHMLAMWAFPDFPTFVPRSVSEFIEGVTISPPNTWYLYALALYFLVAKGLQRLPRWMLLVAASVLSVTVAAGVVDVVSNRGSLLYNLLFFLVGAYLAPRIGRFTARPRRLAAGVLLLAYLAAYAVMRVTGAEQVPGVWPVVSVVGVTTGLAVATLLPGVPLLGRGLTWLGARTLPVYLLHMPLLVLADAALVGPLSDAGNAAQLVGALVLPPLLTGALVAACVFLARLTERDGLSWLWDLPRWQPDRRSGAARPRIPWRTPVAVLVLVAIAVGLSAAAAFPARRSEAGASSATRSGEVSIGAVGDIILYDVQHAVPDDRGRAYFDDVRPWFTEDIVTGNLEQAISAETGYDKCGRSASCLAFRSDPDAAAHLQGFDLLNQANNHSHDYGRTGFDETRTLLRAVGIDAVGERDEIVVTRVGSTSVAMVGFAPYSGFNRITDLRHVRQLVRAAAAQADIVVVHAHMGAEGPGADAVTPGTEFMYGENRGDPIAFAHAAVDAGADVVIGHGPHVLRGAEFYRGRLIAYSLGNFGGGGVFGAEEETRYGAYLSVRLRADGSLVAGRVRPVRFEFDGGAPHPDSTGRATDLINERSRRDFPDTAALIDEGGVLRVP
ncbi:CapA family protein [Microbacterium oxydans]|uniref:CapA family protein n=1 Tax=Microbacterium oxydans TaxID=82380 RepID=UPI0024AD28E5|nr:CapA family protein [Microbacterium oxydans]